MRLLKRGELLDELNYCQFLKMKILYLVFFNKPYSLLTDVFNNDVLCREHSSQSSNAIETETG